jgi:hypothetical protein
LALEELGATKLPQLHLGIKERHIIEVVILVLTQYTPQAVVMLELLVAQVVARTIRLVLQVM